MDIFWFMISISGEPRPLRVPPVWEVEVGGSPPLVASDEGRVVSRWQEKGGGGGVGREDERPPRELQRSSASCERERACTCWALVPLSWLPRLLEAIEPKLTRESRLEFACK